nr:hypothetical protein [Tanacetum cinerariifolium]
MRYSLPCKVDGQGAWDAELDLADSENYVTEKVLENMGFVLVSLSDYGRKMVNDVIVEIHGVKFKADFVVLDYVNKEEPSILFGRDFLVTTKSLVDFGLGEIRMNLTMFEQGIDVIDLSEEVGSSSEEVVKMRKANRRESLNKKEFSEEDKVGIIEHGLPKKICDPENYFLPVKINSIVEMVALVDTKASPLSKSYVEAFEMEGEDDWLGSFEVRRDEDGNVKYGPVAPSFIDIEDDMERALAIETYFNPFKNVIMFKKLVDFLGSLPVQLKDLDWGNEGYGSYKKVDGDGDWHARFEIVMPSGRNFNRAFKTKTTTRKLSRKFKIEDFLRPKSDDKQFDYKDYWTRDGKPILTNHKEVLMKEPIMRIVHKVIVGSLVHRVSSREICQKQDLWMMSALEESRRVNLAWIISNYLYKHAPGTKENSVICAGLYVTKIACFLGHCVDDEIKKCSELINCNQSNQGGSYGLGGDDYVTSIMLDFRGSSSGYAVGGSSKEAGCDDDDDDADMDE